MTPWPNSMPALAERVSRVPTDRRVDDVVDRLTEIEEQRDGFFSAAGGGPAARRERRPLPDGVACFNGMYQRPRAHVDGGGRRAGRRQPRAPRLREGQRHPRARRARHQGPLVGSPSLLPD